MGKQEQRILDYMRTHGSITRGESINSCGVANLTAVISTMRQRGTAIGGRTEEHINRFGEKTKKHVYFLQEVCK